MNEAFSNWLVSGSNWLVSGDMGLCRFQDNKYVYLFVREKKNEFFDYLFSLRYLCAASIERGCSFKYAGIYCRQDGLLYDGNEDLKKITDTDMQSRTPAYLREALQKDVRCIIEKMVDNDRNNLHVTEVTEYTLRKQVESYQSYYAKETARRQYLENIEFELPVYRCNYEPELWTEDSLLAYILDPEGYSEKEAEAFLAENQENILSDFLCNDALLSEYQALVSDQDNPIHIIKKIMAAINATSAKTVNVTVRKDGIEFTFKTEVGTLSRDCTNYYSTWHMAAADRRKFEQLFGRSSEYYPKEILRITYARSILYEVEK